MTLKPETRNQKPEKNQRAEIRIPNQAALAFGFSPFGFLSGFWFLVSSFALVSSFLASRATALPATLPKSPEGSFEVHEWVIFICDPNQPQTNASAMFQSTLPDFIAGRRLPAPVEKESEPGPIGLIRFQGSSGGEKVDVLLENKGGKFLARWPKAQTRSTGVLWQNLVISEKPPTSLEPLSGSSWMNGLRSAEAPFLLRQERGERFLLYDVEPNYKLPVRVIEGPGPLQYYIYNSDTKAPVKDLTFYKHEADGWRRAVLPELGASKAVKPATTPSATPSATPSTRVAMHPTADPGPVARRPATARAGTQPAPATQSASFTQPSTKPATGPAAVAASQPATQPGGTVVALAGTGLTEAAKVLEPWKERLAAQGLPPTDFALILKILEKHALDPKRLTAIYRLDAEQFDVLMPIEITPTPGKTIRVGLVIVKNIDPAIVTEIEDLVAQLGDASWAKREAAHKSLTQLGLAAKPKLESILKNAKDPEIVYRVERLIAALSRDPNAGAVPQPAP